MIRSLKGTVASKKTDAVTVDVGGVGYEVFVPLKTFSVIPEEGHGIFLHIQTVMREDGISLYGFSTWQEREVFNILRTAKGVGVKTALLLLSNFNAEELIGLILNEDISSIRVPGIGPKTAERIVFELRDRVRKFYESAPLPAAQRNELDVELALTALGYTAPQAKNAIRRALETLGGSGTIEAIVKESLRHLVKG